MTPAQQMLLLGIAARRAKDGTGRSIREQADVPQTLLAAYVGVSAATISRWESGQRKPRRAEGAKWAQWLNEQERRHAKTAA